MKTAAVSLLFAGLALAIPAVHKQHKRGTHTDVIIETVWTTTTFYVDGKTKAAFFEQPSSSAVVASSSSVVAAAASSAAPVASVAASVAAAVASVAPKVDTPAAPVTGGGPSGTGEATYYDVSVGKGSCGTQATNSDAVVALSIPIMANGANPNNNPLCGKTITINYQGATHTAKVYDTCEGCAPGNIDLSTEFFKVVFPKGDGRVPGVSWSISA